MIKKMLLVVALAWPLFGNANPLDDKCPQFAPFGSPVMKVQDQYYCRTNYAIQYNTETKTSYFVLEHVTKESMTGPAKRKDDFRPDADIPKQFQANLADYASEGKTYDRGHMAPAGDNTQTEKIMSESFLLSNMVPQVANNNRGIWKQLETKVRTYVASTNDLYVASGPIYDAGYKTIGPGKVGVPTRLYKIVIDVKGNKASAYIFPNTALPANDVEKYKVTIADVEKATGINFNPKLVGPNVGAIESIKNW